MNSARNSIAVLMTCHNRREKTVACLASVGIAGAAIADRFEYALYVTDDGSTDGTSEAVLSIEPNARIIRGSGQLFWNGGMRAAFAAAIADGQDFYLWLNDDVTLDPDALARLLTTFEEKLSAGAEPIVVGAMRGPNDQTTYSALERPESWRKTTFKRVPPAAYATRCETFNGNCVLIPASAVALLGNLDGHFTHSIGDLDYGLRATQAGIPIWMAPHHVGTCVIDHTISGSFRDKRLSLSRRWSKLTSKKGLPPAAWALFCRRHAGPAWPMFWALPYARTVASSLLPGSLGSK